MLWGKIYIVWEPSLVQAALRAKGATFEPFVQDFAEKTLGLSPEAVAKTAGDRKFLLTFTDAIHMGMKASYVIDMNTTALNFISGTLDAVKPGADGGLEVPNLYLWIRDLISVATSKALLGNSNPFEKDPTLVDAMW